MSARSTTSTNMTSRPARARAAVEPLPLAAIYLLRKAEERGGARHRPARRRRRGRDADRRTPIAAAICRRSAGPASISPPASELARAVPVFSAERRWGFERFDEQADGCTHARRLRAQAASDARRGPPRSGQLGSDGDGQEAHG